MKKVLYAIAAVALTVFAASCAREVADVQQNGDLVEVSFNVAMPNAVATKAISDGTLATKLIFAVYDEAGNYLADLSKTSEEDGPVTITSETEKTFKVTVPLVRDLSYQFLFVAKSANDNGFYTVIPADKKVAVDYTKLTANDDNADLFYAFTGVVLVNDAMNTNIALNRPVAQINVAVPDADLTGAAYSIKTDDFLSGLTFKQLYPEFNFFTGAVAGTPADVTIGQATRTTDKITVGGVQYNRIAMVYALVDKKNVDATINIKATDKNNAAHDIVRNVPNVPIQANYRTNIIGNIFTSNINFNVVVDNNFATPDYNVVISSQEELDEVIAGINAGASTATSLTLEADIDGTVLDFSALDSPLSQPVTVSGTNTVVIQNLEAAQTTPATPAVTIDANAKAVINGADITSSNDNPRGVAVEKGAEVVINDSSIEVSAGTGNNYPRALQINDTDAKVTVTGSEISSPHYPVNLISSSGSSVIKFENTTIQGWCILNIWSSDNTFELKNCTLKSLNDKTYNADGWNDFAAFVFNKNTPSVDNNTVKVIDCELFVEATTGNKQRVANLGGQNNTLYCRNTVITGTNTNTSGYLFGLVETGATYTLDLDDTVTGTWDGEDI